MGKEKGSRVFFEVYRKQMKDEKANGIASTPPVNHTGQAADDIGKVEVSTDAGDAELRSQESEVGSQGSMTEDLGLMTRHGSRQQRLGLKRDEVYVRQDTLIYAALGAVFLSIGCFFIGHKLGYDKGRKVELTNAESFKQTSVGSAEEKVLQPITKKTEEAQEPVPITASQTPQPVQSQLSASGGIKEGKWTLRIISYKIGDQNTKKASELARTIQREIGHDAFVAKASQELVVCVGKFDNRDSSELRTLQKELRDFEYENRKQFKGCYPVRLR